MKALIIEDEAPAATQLVNILKKTGKIDKIEITDSIKSTVSWLSGNQMPDIVFMDIHIADGSAFKIFDYVEITCPIIFTTAYDEYAIDAFKVNSIDYLLKPITQEALENAFHKLNQLSQANNLNAELTNIIKEISRGKSYKIHFLVTLRGNKMIPLLAEDIAFFYIDEGKVSATTFERNNYKLDFTLDELNIKLNPAVFFRANRQFIISKKAVKEIDSWYNNRLFITLKIPVPEKILISRTRVTEFKEWITGN